jgi:nitroimidazol reductase NimA-like FMN-containing flavoprotein (pyridoxamine 5'-phosphate oxidase superfamily)
VKTRPPRPTFRDLPRAEIDALLARGSIGRLAYSFHDRVDIVPLGYVYDGGFVYGRTSYGPKIRTLAHHQWVAFQVDEVEDLENWRSVVVHGAFFPLIPDESEGGRERWRRGLEAARRLVPESLTDDDPFPDREILFRISVDEVSGRAASAR